MFLGAIIFEIIRLSPDAKARGQRPLDSPKSCGEDLKILHSRHKLLTRKCEASYLTWASRPGLFNALRSATAKSPEACNRLVMRLRLAV